jgi:hypothetical protein
MSLNRHDIVQQVDLQLKAHPNAILQTIALKLGISEQFIEAALQEIEGLSFREFQANRRLEQAFRQLGELSIAANGPWERRAKQRVIIPRATVRYRIHSFWSRKPDYSSPCPLVDFSSDGLALLADEDAQPQKQISLVLKFPGDGEELQVEGFVAYSAATGIAGYRYRIGIRFLPFDNRKGSNTPKVLDALTRIEKIYAP